MTDWPLTIQDVFEARLRIAKYLEPTPLRTYGRLDAVVGEGISVHVKHENHQPTNSFKVRNGLSALSALEPERTRSGVIGATRGNHGLGLCWAGAQLGIRVKICVPEGNSPGKNAAMRALGAEVIEEGKDYDSSVEVAHRLAEEQKLEMVHSTNDHMVIAGAATMSLEMLEQAPDLDALVLAVGGGSQAVGALTVARALRPDLEVFGVQASRASAIHDSWHKGEPLALESADTFADGLATRQTYSMTFGPLCRGLADFVTVTEEELRQAVCDLLDHTHQLAEGAGAAGLAGLKKLAPRLAGKKIGIAITGANIDLELLLEVLRLSH